MHNHNMRCARLRNSALLYNASQVIYLDIPTRQMPRRWSTPLSIESAALRSLPSTQNGWIGSSCIRSATTSWSSAKMRPSFVNGVFSRRSCSGRVKRMKVGLESKLAPPLKRITGRLVAPLGSEWSSLCIKRTYSSCLAPFGGAPLFSKPVPVSTRI